MPAETTLQDLPFIALTALAGNEPHELNSFQRFLLPASDELSIVWWFVWLVTLAVVIRYAIVHGERE
jgi:type II secretory pathway component PulF